MTVPDVAYRVEIAFNAGYRTLAVDRVWEDVSEFVELGEGMTVNYGRADEVSTADANQLSLVFDNTDGRFTWGNPDSPYYPNVKVGRPIRLTALIGALESVRFTGYVNEWPVEWPGGSDTYATASVSASSRLSRLGLDSPLAQVLDRAITATAPTYFWPLTEPKKATAGAEVEGRAVSLTSTRPANTVFGVAGGSDETAGPFVTDGRPGVNIQRNSRPLQGSLPTLSLGPGVIGGITVGVFAKGLQPAPGPASSFLSLSSALTDGAPLLGDLDLGEDLAYLALPSGAYVGAGGDGLADYIGLTHHIAATIDCDGTDFALTLYQDGVLVDTDTTPAETINLSLLQINNPGTGSLSDIVVGRVGIWDRALRSDELSYIARAGIDGFRGDTTDQRLLRYADWANIDPAELTATPSPIAMAGMEAAGEQIVGLMREVETTEAGVLYDNREGQLVLRARSERYGVPVALEVDFSGHQAGGDFSPRVDRQGLVNVGNGTNTTDTVTVTFVDEVSREEYGDAGYDVQTAALDPTEPHNLVAWAVNSNAQPRPRVPAVTLDVLADWIASPSLPDLLDLDIGSKVSLLNRPAQAPPTTSDYFVEYFTEGYAEAFGVGSWAIGLNLSPAWPHEAVLILDDPDLGVLDQNLLAL